MIPVYSCGFETSLILTFSNGIMVSTCPIPDIHPQNRSLATSVIYKIISIKQQQILSIKPTNILALNKLNQPMIMLDNIILVRQFKFIRFNNINIKHKQEKMENSENVSITDFVPLEKIGEGSFSSVYKVKRKADNNVYALKKIKIATLKDKQRKNALNQVRILASLTSPFIIQYRQAFFDQNLNLLCIVMELANNGDLQKKIEKCRNNYMRFPEQEIWKMIYQTVKGLEILHSNFIMHRDIKTANIFISDGVYKLGDLNVSKIFNPEDILASTQTGTPYYASPQIWRDQPYDSKSDIWSIGCVAYQMCALKPPFKGKDLEDLFQKVQKGRYEDIPIVYSRDLSEFIKLCLKKRPFDRPTCYELIQKILIKKCIQHKIDFLEEHENKDLLKTIKLPIDLKELHQTLPKSAYESESLKETQQKFKDKIKQQKNDRRQISQKRKNKLYRYMDVNRKLSQNHHHSSRCNPQTSNEKKEGIEEKLFFNNRSREEQAIQKEIVQVKTRNRSYISEQKLKKLSNLADPVKMNKGEELKNRRLSQDEKNTETQQRRKNILGQISLLRKMSENNANMKKQSSQRYYNAGNSLKNIIKKVESTDRITERRNHLRNLHREGKPNIHSQNYKSKQETQEKEMQEIGKILKNTKRQIHNLGQNKELKKMGSHSRIKNQYASKNMSYHRSQVLHKNLRESADYISFLLQQNQKEPVNCQSQDREEKIISPRSKDRLFLNQHRKINKISSTPYLSGILQAKQQISSVNNHKHEIGFKKKNRSQFRGLDKTNTKMHIY